MADKEESSVPVVALTAAVGAVVLLLILLFGIGKKDDNKEQEQGEFQSISPNKHCTMMNTLLKYRCKKIVGIAPPLVTGALNIACL